MDEILYLEPDEEITSVIDKLKSLPGASVALVLPKKAPLAASVVNLKLLQREATKLGKQVAIVTQDKVGTRLATQVGIPVYAAVGDDEPVATPARRKPPTDDVIELDGEESTEQTSEEDDDGVVPVHRYDASKAAAQATESTAASPAPLPRRPARSSGPVIRFKRGPVLTLLGIALLAGATWLFFVYPQATVMLAVASEPIQETVTVTIDNNITEPKPDEGKLPGQKVQVETTVKETFDATGEKEVGTKASGEVTINNRLGEEVAVPKGSTLERSGIKFLTTEEGSVGAATVSLDASGNVLVKPGTKTVRMEAESVGAAANLAPGDFVITSFAGTKRDRVTASNSATFAGGESHTVKVVTNDDIEGAKQSIGDKVRDQLTLELKSKAQGITVLGNTIETSVVDARPNKQPDEEAEQFELEAKIRTRSIGFEANAYQDLVVALVTKTLPEGKELVVSNLDSVETTVERQSYDEGLLVLRSTLQTEMVQKLDKSALKATLRGKTALEAERLLREHEGIRSADVTLRPTFLQQVPRNESQIVVEIVRE